MATNTHDGTIDVSAGALSGTSMRYHELAIQRWLNKLFFVREGYPVPVVFTSPMDAFSNFRQLWADNNNPFKYLLDLVDAKGTPLYEPFPSPVRYPIISVHRKNWKLRQYQNFSIHRWRHLNWPTVSNTGPAVNGVPNVGTGLTKFDLGNVTTSRIPMAWDYRFQIDHFCLRPDTQAFFINQLMEEFYRTGGTTPQTWIKVAYPGWGERLVRLYIDGEVESMTPEEPETDKSIEFRTSITVVLEGFDVDLRYKVFPAFWTLVFASGSVDPTALETAYRVLGTQDARIDNANPVLDDRPDVPTQANDNWVYQDIGELPVLEIDPEQIVGQNQFGVMTITRS